MDAVLSKPLAVVGLLVVLTAALVALQGFGSLVAPPEPVTATGQVLGQAGFAYLGGLRVFAAAVLWNRLEPQFDEFYSARSLDQMTFLLPSLYLVERLNPQFVQAYYNASFILAKRGQWAEAYRVALEGIRNNPESGLMRANLVQLLLMEDRGANLERALAQAATGLGTDMVYENPEDQFESLAIFRVAYELAGRSDVVAAIEQRQAELRAAGVQPSGLAHDHDGDGLPDH